MANLEELQLSFCTSIKISEGCLTLPKPKVLSLAGCRLKTLPGNLFKDLKGLLRALKRFLYPTTCTKLAPGDKS